MAMFVFSDGDQTALGRFALTPSSTNITLVAEEFFAPRKNRNVDLQNPLMIGYDIPIKLAKGEFLMKRFAAFLYLAVFLLSVACYANPSSNPVQGDDRGHASLQLGSNKVEVDHGRPVLKGRNPEQMIQPGQTWRMGSG